MFEHHSHPLLPRHRYLGRLALCFLAGACVILVSLWFGMLGYHSFEAMTWMDAFVNAAMILSGMGPLAQPQTASGKLFAGLYALYSGFVVILVSGIVFAPVVHRILHRFHMQKNHRKHAEHSSETLPATEKPV